jgi:hypothetical protein
MIQPVAVKNYPVASLLSNAPPFSGKPTPTVTPMGRQRVAGSTPRGIVRTQQRKRAISPEGLSHACPFRLAAARLHSRQGEGSLPRALLPSSCHGWLLRSPMKGGADRTNPATLHPSSCTRQGPLHDA